jgi:plastocyanin
MRTSILSLFAVVLVLALGATACGKESGTEGSGGTTTIAGQKANDHGTKDVSGESSVELEQDNFYFEPTVLKGTPGEKLTIELSNEGSALHNFSIPDQSIDQDVQPDAKGEVPVTFPDSGTLVFFCKYHQSQGMVGALEVS